MPYNSWFRGSLAFLNHAVEYLFLNQTLLFTKRSNLLLRRWSPSFKFLVKHLLLWCLWDGVKRRFSRGEQSFVVSAVAHVHWQFCHMHVVHTHIYVCPSASFPRSFTAWWMLPLQHLPNQCFKREEGKTGASAGPAGDTCPESWSVHLERNQTWKLLLFLPKGRS